MRKLFLLFFLTLYSLSSYSQEGEIIYKTSYYKENSVDSEFANKIVRELELLTFSLRYTKNESFFEHLDYIPYDNLSSKLALTTANAKSDWYQNPIKRESYYNTKISSKQYLVVRDERMNNWVLSNETKNIEKFTCYKATLTLLNERNSKKYTVEAWYTPDVSLPYGPIGFGGLPGLILQLKYKQTIFIAKNIVLNPEKSIKKIPKMNSKNPITVKEMVTLMRKARKVTDD